MSPASVVLLCASKEGRGPRSSQRLQPCQYFIGQGQPPFTPPLARGADASSEQ